MKISVTVLLVCAISCAHAQRAHEQPTPAVSSIRVSGEAVALMKPERALIDVGVLTQERQSQAALTQNAKQLDAVLGALHRVLGPEADIETIDASLSPNYQYRSNGAQPPINGYTAMNIVRVQLDDLQKIGAVIDAATQAGANHVESVQYGARDAQPMREQALRAATLKARSAAEALAAALNLKIVRVISLQESRDNLAPPGDPTLTDPTLADPRGVAAEPGPGGLEIAAAVVLTVEVSPL